VAAAFGMGQSTSGYWAGSLMISEDQPSLALATPAALSYTATSPDVEVISISGQLRQVNAPQALADIVTDNAFAYEIRYYLPGQVGGIVGGVRQVSGGPFVTWKIENPDASTNTYNRLRITEMQGSDSRVYDYVYTDSSGSWKLDYPGGIREDECAVSIVTNGASVVFGDLPSQGGEGFPGFTRTVTATTRVPGGSDQFKVRRVYEMTAWGEALVQETLSPDTNPQTTTYTYYPDYPARYGGPRAQKIIRPDGSWRWFTYDTLGRYDTVYSSFGNVAPTGDSPPAGVRHTIYSYWPSGVSGSGDDGTAEPDTPRCMVEYENPISGYIAVSTHFTVFPSAGMRIDVQTTKRDVPWDDPSNLFTTNRYYTSGPNTNRLKSVVLPDSTLQTFDYAVDASGFYRTNLTASGQSDPTFSRVIDGTTNLAIVNLGGYPVLSITWNVSNGVILSQETYSNFDGFGRPQRVTHLDGTYEDTYYACCGIDSMIDRDGVATQCWHDLMKRQTAATRLGITTTNVLDASGRIVKTIRIGSDGTQLTQSRTQFDLAGQSVAETNALGGGTTYVQATNTAGALVRTTTYADGGTRIETNFCDGTLQSVTGTAAHAVRYEYGVETDWQNYPNDYGNRYTLEVKLLANGTDSAEWTKTYTDAAGRVYQTLYAAPSAPYPASLSFYNPQGQLWKEVDSDGVTTIYTFNPKGEPDYTITALDDTTRDISDYQTLFTSLENLKSTTNRITRTVRSVVPAGGGSPALIRADTYVWKDSGSAGTLVSRSDSSTDGLQSWQTQYRDVNTPVTSHSQTTYGANSTRTVTTTAPDNSYSITAYTNGRCISVTSYNSSGAQIARTAFSYDAHGRQASVTDTRNGTTGYAYNSADLLISVTSPNPGTLGGSPQTTTTLYNPMLQATNVVNPDGTSITTDYYLTGELKRNYGSRLYPVGYSYDYAGRMKTMTNWSSFASGAGARVTTWNYNPYRGWLDSKQYADGHGPSYAYTDAGRLQSRTWARTVSGQALTTTYGFDNAGAVLSVTYSDSTPGITCVYDRLGRLATNLCNGITTILAYNTAGELLSQSFSGGLLAGLSVTNGYDPYLRRTNLASLNASTLLTLHTFSYDAASRLQTVTDNSGSPAYSATYSYVANSPLVSNIVHKQSSTTRMTTTKQYDYLNRLLSVSSAPSAASAIIFGYSYNNANQRIRSTLADGSYWLYDYDSLGQVRSGRRYWSDQTSVAGQQFQYAHDDIGNRTQTKAGGDQSGASLRTANYGANSLNQYTNRDMPAAIDVMGLGFASNAVTVNNQAAYRKGEYFRAEVPVSNGSTSVWQSVSVAATNQTTVSGNVYVPKNQEQFYYDLDGNLTNDGRWTYTWDGENRLAKMAPNTSIGLRNSIMFEYDWQGRRIHKQVWGNTNWTSTPTNDVKFVYDGWNLLAELNRTNNAVIRTFMWGSDLSGTIQSAGGVGGLLELTYKGAQATNCFVAFDGNGNVAALADAGSTNILAQYEYGPFGEVIRATGPMAKANPFRFSTKYQDDETDLLYYGYRYYNASTGRWITRDPICDLAVKGGHQAGPGEFTPPVARPCDYTFVDNQPVLSADLLGLIRWTPKRQLNDEPWDLDGSGRIMVYYYWVQTDLGRDVLVWKAEPPNSGAYFCHGLTFDGVSAPDGPLSPTQHSVPIVLQDEWVPICCGRAGHREGEAASAIAVFGKTGPFPSHSGKVATTVVSGGVFDEYRSMLYSKQGAYSRRPAFDSFHANAGVHGKYTCYVKKGDPRLTEQTCCPGPGENEVPDRWPH
jgi:RHS repeat-associated protein